MKRVIHLVDNTKTEAGLTVWGEQARNFDTELQGRVVAMKGIRVGMYNGSFSAAHKGET